MFLVKPCRSCGTQLRFPIDRGKIKVTCQCGKTFIADPDDPELFKNSTFDIPGKKKKQSISLAKQYRELKKKVITSIYNFKYDIQNFPLLPTRNKLRVAGIMAALAAVLLLLAAMLIPAQYLPDYY
jgi:hypothetical protein